MGSCFSCNCFHSHRRKVLEQEQHEIEKLMQNGKTPHSDDDNLQNHKQHHIQIPSDDENDKFSLNAIRKQRDEYDSLRITSYITHIQRSYPKSSSHQITDKILQLIISYTPQTKILLIETGQTELLESDIEHIFHSIIINRNATLTTNAWNPALQTGGKLLITCISSIFLRENAKICLNSQGYKGGHCTYIEDDQFIDAIHDDTDDEEVALYQHPPQQRQHQYDAMHHVLHHDPEEQQQLNELYASYSGESYQGLGIANSIKNNYGGGGAGQIWGSGGGAGYGTVGFKGQYDKQYSNKSCGKGGSCYGTHLLTELYLGSGGGAAYGGYSGGCGGGALRVKCKRLWMDKDAVVSCNGDGGAHKYLSGGGSGGSVYLLVEDAMDMEMNKGAKIEAIGGEKKELYGYGYKSDDVYNCGRGGFGRIRIECKWNMDRLKKRIKNEYKGYIEPTPFIG